MKVAIMQPYFFPYIGYMQLVHAVDLFVFYDDVNFVKKGWINRNRLLSNGEVIKFSVPLVKVSQNKMINEVKLGIDDKWISRFLATLSHSYKKAPYFEQVNELVKDVLLSDADNIGDLAALSVVKISEYLGLRTEFKHSSKEFNSSQGIDRADRLISIAKECKANDYVNASGGRELYDKAYFSEHGIKLHFIENKVVEYPQLSSAFEGGLSMIDVLMFNSVASTNDLINNYKLS